MCTNKATFVSLNENESDNIFKCLTKISMSEVKLQTKFKTYFLLCKQFAVCVVIKMTLNHGHKESQHINYFILFINNLTIREKQYC